MGDDKYLLTISEFPSKSLHMSANSLPLIDCTQCSGSGKQPLPKELAETLQAVKRLKKASANKVRDFVAWKGTPTVINNRLHRLLDLGLVTRDRDGMTLYYSLTKPTP